MSLDAKITQVQAKPVKLDKDGMITEEPYATISLKVPLDSESQKSGVLEILDLLSREWVELDITHKQQKMPLESNDKPPSEVLDL